MSFTRRPSFLALDLADISRRASINLSLTEHQQSFVYAVRRSLPLTDLRGRPLDQVRPLRLYLSSRTLISKGLLLHLAVAS